MFTFTLPTTNYNKTISYVEQVERSVRTLLKGNEMNRNLAVNNLIKEIDKVEYKNPHTLIFWKTGEVTHVKAIDEPFDAEKGLAMGLLKYLLGGESDYYDIFKVFHEGREDEKKAKKKKRLESEIAARKKELAKLGVK